jgi:hypothetical protein
MEMTYRHAGLSGGGGQVFGGLDLHSGEPGARLRRRIEEEPALSKAVKEIEVIRGHFY